MKAAVIRTEELVEGELAVGSFSTEEKGTNESTLDWLQRLVGGLIEPLPQTIFGCEAYVKEGKGALAPNMPATVLAWECGALDPSDYIAGPLVLVGPLTPDGETTGITKQGLRKLRDWVLMFAASHNGSARQSCGARRRMARWN